MTAADEAAWLELAVIALAGQWTIWPGLPPGLTAAAVVSALVGGALPAAVASDLGRVPLDRLDVGALQVWANADDVVVLVEWIDPPCDGGVAELLAALGAPEREGPGRHRRSGATTTEYMYAGRGLAITAAESYDSPPSFETRLATVQLFAPTTMQAFVLELGGDVQVGPRMIGPGRR